MKTEKCRALLLKRLRMAPAEDTPFGGSFEGEGKEGAGNVACSSSCMDSSRASMPWCCQCCPCLNHTFLPSPPFWLECSCTRGGQWPKLLLMSTNLDTLQSSSDSTLPQFPHTKRWWKQQLLTQNSSTQRSPTPLSWEVFYLFFLESQKCQSQNGFYP